MTKVCADLSVLIPPPPFKIKDGSMRKLTYKCKRNCGYLCKLLIRYGVKNFVVVKMVDFSNGGFLSGE
jgi:hypothetical protein